MPGRYFATLAAAFVALAVLVAGCGADEGSSASGQDVDGTFIAGMVPHHESAIEMAEIAQKQADHPEIKDLADQIIADQEAEIAELETAHERIFGEPLSAAEHEPMEMSSEMSGDTDMAALEDSKPFDQAFIDMMIPHHRGAIEMARMEVADGEDAELIELANSIIEAQSTEIEEMNSWRTEWYGEPSPAGGVPSEEESSDAMSGMDH